MTYTYSDGHNGSREVIAYFSNQREAQKAARQIHDDVAVADIHRVSAQQAHNMTQGAEAGVSVVEIGALAWWGMAIGIVLGALFGAWAFSGRLPIPGLIAPTLSSGSVTVTYLWAGIFACIGWLIGALITLFRDSARKAQYEMRVVVSGGRNFTSIERALAEAGATDVVTKVSGRRSEKY